MIYREYLKRTLDALFGILSIVVLSPVFLIIACAIKINSNGPVLFTQKRAGKNGREFDIVKFRTMLIFEESYNEDGTEMDNYDRITKVGHFLRKASLDELPQLFNIVKGDMSIVGPRPTLPYQIEKYNAYQMQRLTVRPGLTGLAQVSGRNTLTWEKKIELDVDYVKTISFVRDVFIVLKTFFVVFDTRQVGFTSPDEISKHKGDLFTDVGHGKESSSNGFMKDEKE